MPTTMLKRNEELSYRPLFLPINHHVHYFISKHTVTSTLHTLIRLAQKTSSFTISTSADIHTSLPALIQIEMINKKQSVVVLIETCHLPTRQDSLQFWLIKSLIKTVFSSKNTIYVWGHGIHRLSPYLQYGLFNEEHLQQSHFVDIEKEYREFDFKLFHRYRLGSNQWSLQEVIADLCNQFLDIQETMNMWSQGFDRPIENIDPRKQQPLINYAINQCLAVTKVAYIMDKNIFGRHLPSK